MELSAEALRGYIDYFRDIGVYDLYRHGESGGDAALQARLQAFIHSLAPASPWPSSTPSVVGVEARATAVSPARTSPVPAARPLRASTGPDIVITPPAVVRIPAPVPSSYAAEDQSPEDQDPFAPPPMPLIGFNQLAALPSSRVPPVDKAAALQQLRDTIGDCTRCPLAYAGRHTIVFADGDPNADLMFVGEGPGADEDTSGVPFVGKAGQLLNNMITAMGLRREQVYIANIVKCRPPKNRVPEPVEANTCSPFLLQQIDIVQPKVIVALGATAAMYLLGVRQPLNTLRGQWHDVRGTRCTVTYHPAFLLRDPRQKGEAWKDLQRVMGELHLKPPARV